MAYETGSTSIRAHIQQAITTTVNNIANRHTILDKTPHCNKLFTPARPFQTASFVPLGTAFRSE
eukprot:UN05882